MDVTLTNSGAQTVTISSIAITTADFLQTNTCGAQLGPGASCTISVTFQPAHVGSLGAILKITDDGGSSPQFVSLLGTGTQ
ncbi:MAG: choice-of-anchor D domain-containing protein [Acidobacteriales bacterium]|nr:choice-of-anchor D domain-containing protein [Terriglobales bacterium]